MTLPRWSKSHLEPRECDLKDLDFLALAFGLGLLVLLFRQIESWLHQHIFKVGWLLTNDVQITTVLYYIIFLPGIALHELTLWLAAGALRVRAEGALRFPEDRDISELRLSLIRLAPGASYAKLILISLSPLATGLAALWAISATLFPASEITALAMPGSIKELGAAIRSLTTTADFWLWLYIVFTIANRSFPALPVNLTTRWKSILFVALPALCFVLWRTSVVANPAIALGIEGLLRGLTLIIAQITLLNMGGVLALGAIEAVIKRFTSRSASFRDGRMITLEGGETAPAQAGRSQARSASAEESRARQAAAITSIYDMKLPIPGPPGREPVSRQAVAVVNLDRPDPELAARPRPSLSIPQSADAADESAQEIPQQTHDESAGEPRLPSANQDAVAPFARPFAEQEAPTGIVDDWDEDLDDSDDEPFARPFVMSTRSDKTAAADPLQVDSDTEAAEVNAPKRASAASTKPDRSSRRPSKTRPAPKPSQKADRKGSSAEPPDADELEYEDLDEIDACDPDDGPYDDEL